MTLFLVYDMLKRRVPTNEDGTVNSYYTLGCGAVAGTIGQTVAYPLDLIRRKIQVQGFLTGTKKLDGDQYYKGVYDAAKKIWRAEGFSGFYRGIQLEC